MNDVRESGASALRACDSTGRYERVQCDNPSNPKVCWCVDRYGREIPRTRKRGPTKPACDSTGKERKK